MWQSVFKCVDKFVTEINLQRMDLSYDHGLHISIDEVFGYLEFFSEDVELSVTPYEPDQENVSIRDVINLWQLRIRPQS